MPKEDYIKAFFEEWGKDVERAEKLLKETEYYLEAILILSCHVGGLGAMRYPALKDNEAYKKIVLDYSGKANFYKQIDLLFFLQWSRSLYKDHGNYTTLKDYAQLAQAIVAKFGDEDAVKAGTRYVDSNDFVAAINENTFLGFDHKNLEAHLPLFSNCEMLYRYVRCQAVHSVDFPFVNKVHSYGEKEEIKYEDNHAITGQVLLETVTGILENLSKDCVTNKKWPFEL